VAEVRGGAVRAVQEPAVLADEAAADTGSDVDEQHRQVRTLQRPGLPQRHQVGLAHSTVDKHLEVLLDAELIEDAGFGEQDARGRPGQMFRVSAGKGVGLVPRCPLARPGSR
jgi:DNA-binding transcriptional ArsR family regulator